MGIENIDALKNVSDNLDTKKAEEETAHVVDENPEDHVGAELPDPWPCDEDGVYKASATEEES